MWFHLACWSAWGFVVGIVTDDCGWTSGRMLGCTAASCLAVARAPPHVACVCVGLSAFAVSSRVRVVGLTGGVASGKSEVSRQLRQLGVPVVDADAISHEVLQKGRPAHAAVAAAFREHPGVVAADGRFVSDARVQLQSVPARAWSGGRRVDTGYPHVCTLGIDYTRLCKLAFSPRTFRHSHVHAHMRARAHTHTHTHTQQHRQSSAPRAGFLRPQPQPAAQAVHARSDCQANAQGDPLEQPRAPP